MESGAWWATVRGVTKSWAWLSYQLFSILNCGYTNINKIDSESINIKRDAFKDTFIFDQTISLLDGHIQEMKTIYSQSVCQLHSI